MNKPAEDKEQIERFKRTAREHGVELDEEKLAETLRRMAKRENAKDKKKDDE